MKKVFVTVCLTLLLTFSLFACAGGDTKDSSTSGETEGGFAALDSESYAEPGTIIGHPTVFKLDGDTYTYPIDNISAFEANGWVVEEDYSGYMVSANKSQRIEYYKGDAKILVTFYNVTDEKLAPSECYISRFLVFDYDLAGIELELAGGIAMGKSTNDDIRSLYGEPDNFAIIGNEGEETEIFSYEFTDENDESKYTQSIDVDIRLNSAKLVYSIELSLEYL